MAIVASGLVHTLLLVAAGPVAGPSAAPVAEPSAASPVAVATVPVLLEGSPLGLSEVGAAVATALAWRPSVRGIRFEELESLHPGAGSAVRSCGSDRSCLAKSLAPTGAGLALVAVVRPQDNDVVVSVQLVDLKSERVLVGASEVAASNRAQETLAEVTARLFAEASHPLAGGLRVEVSPTEAQVELQGDAPISSDGLRYQLKPGPYSVSAKLEGFTSAKETVDVVAAEEKVLRMSLEEDSSVWSSPWLWLGIGAAVVGASVTAAVVAGGGEDCYCLTGDPNLCPPSC